MNNITATQTENQADPILKGLIDAQERLIALKDVRIAILRRTIELMEQKVKSQECQSCGSEKNVWYRIKPQRWVCNTCWEKVADAYKETV